MKYTAMLACGNYHGVVGFAKAKGPAIPIALQKVGAQTRQCARVYLNQKWDKIEQGYDKTIPYILTLSIL